MTRREMLQLSAAGAAGMLSNQVQAAGTKKRIVVAGAGIAGLCCAYELNRLGHDVTVLEASGRVGGHIKTVRDDLPDGMYVDAGAEQFTKPGYDIYWSYVREFNLPYVQDHRRDHMLRRIGDKLYSEEDLANPKVLGEFGLNQKEIKYLSQHAWWELPHLYLDKYASAFLDEYKPFGVGLDDLDHISSSELLQKEGASSAAIGFIGGNNSALHSAWHHAVLMRRGTPLFPTQVFRLVGGNTLLPETFARKLGDRVKLGCPVTAIDHSPSGVKVTYREFRGTKQISADYLVCCMSAVMLRQIPVTPAFPEEKAWAIANVPYYSAVRPIFQARTKFWQEQKQSINIVFSKPTLHHVWSMPDDVQTSRGLITGTSDASITAKAALTTFRDIYPGTTDTIESASVIDWSKDPWCLACETLSYRVGELKKYWPALVEPHGRIHFAGAYCDNLNWGQEAGTRSAHRVAKAIDAA